MNKSDSPKGFSQPNYRVGIVSFTDPRDDVKLVAEREEYIQHCHSDLVSALEKNGFDVVNPQNTLQRNKDRKLFGINSLSQINELKLHFVKEKISAIILGCFAWNEPNVLLELAKELGVPVGLVTRNNPLWPGITAITSTGASFWESSFNYYIKHHERFLLPIDGSVESMIPWLKASCALNYLRNGKLLLWGGTPALNMEHLNDDIPYLKRFIIGDIETQDQYLLVKKGTEILQNDSNRISDFKEWLTKNGCSITFDNKMINEEIFSKQIALYLAAKDIISEHHLKRERVIGVSIKCQPELSVEYGITPCLLPAFLPFPEDHSGEKPIIPTVCEGDIKGLLTSAILYSLNNNIPPLFGDLKIITDNYFIIANCGAASAYYANLSNSPKKTLSKSTIQAQCQGVAGGAFGYHTPASQDEATYARLCRIDGNYVLQFGIGKIVTIQEKKEIAWGTTWPHTAVQLKVTPETFLKTVGTNHLSLTMGNYQKELSVVGKLLDVPIVRLDSEESIENFLDVY
ncbi:MAG: fucose isomerase [Candidatus Heimdallarchaeota archaeon]